MLALSLPVTGSSAHAVGHSALGVPVLLLLVVAIKTWPVPAGGRRAWIARSLLLAGLSVFGGGLLIEAIGAFGYNDADQQVNGLAVLHDIGVFLGPLGIVLSIAGAITSVGVAVAARRGAAGSRYVTAAVVLAAVAAVAFLAGGLIFGY